MERRSGGESCQRWPPRSFRFRRICRQADKAASDGVLRVRESAIKNENRAM